MKVCENIQKSRSVLTFILIYIQLRQCFRKHVLNTPIYLSMLVVQNIIRYSISINKPPFYVLSTFCGFRERNFLSNESNVSLTPLCDVDEDEHAKNLLKTHLHVLAIICNNKNKLLEVFIILTSMITYLNDVRNWTLLSIILAMKAHCTMLTCNKETQ